MKKKKQETTDVIRFVGGSEKWLLNKTQILEFKKL